MVLHQMNLLQEEHLHLKRKLHFITKPNKHKEALLICVVTDCGGYLDQMHRYTENCFLADIASTLGSSALLGKRNQIVNVLKCRGNMEGGLDCAP